MWRSRLCGRQSLPSAKLRFPLPRIPHKSSRGHSRRGSLSLVPVGESTMFDELFTRRRAVARHRAGPLLEERLRYLAHLAELGMRRIDLQIMAHFLLVMRSSWAWRIGQVRSSRAKRSARRPFSGLSIPNLVRFRGPGVPARCSHASPSPGSAFWGGFSQHRTHPFRSPESLLHLQSIYAARGVWHLQLSRVVARRWQISQPPKPRQRLTPGDHGRADRRCPSYANRFRWLLPGHRA